MSDVSGCRPTLIEERLQLLEQFRGLSGADCERLQAEFLAKRVIAWDIKDIDGKLVDITAVNVLKLRPTLLNRINCVVLGTEPSDIDPLWSTETTTAKHLERCG